MHPTTKWKAFYFISLLPIYIGKIITGISSKIPHLFSPFIPDSNKTLSDVLEEFEKDGQLSEYDKDKDIDYAGFKVFMDIFLEVDTPEELCQHLFLSFVRLPNPLGDKQEGGNAGAANLGSLSKISDRSDGHSKVYRSLPSSIHHGLSERLLHNLTEKLQSMASNKSLFDNQPPQPNADGGGEIVRCRTHSVGACVNPSLAVKQTRKVRSSHTTPPSANCSRGSSRKSNNSSSVSNDKIHCKLDQKQLDLLENLPD